MANKQIKGISVVIDGNTTKLTEALRSTETAAKSTQAELSQINRQLKYDPNNVTLIAQKHEILGKRVSETKAKLETLKTAQDQFDQSALQTEKGAEQYRALQREIIKTEGQLKYLQDQYNKTDVTTVKLQQVSSKFGEIGSKATDAGKSISTHVTAPIAAVGAASLAAFREVDEGLDIVVSKTGASGKSLELMQNIAKNLATEIPTDFQTAGSAVGEVNTRFGATGKTLEDLSGKFIKFAALNDTDVSSSVDQVSAVLNAFGQSSADAGDVLDALNSTGQATGISMDTLAQDLSANAAQLKDLGLTAQQASGFMGMVEMSGLDTSTAMAGLKKAMKNAADDGQTLDQAIAGFSDTMQSNKSDTEKLQAAYDLFGAKAGAAIYNATKSGKLNLKDLSGTLGNFSGSVDKTFTDTLDPIDQFQMSLNSLKEVGADIGNSLAAVLQPVLQDLSKQLKSLAAAWATLPAGTQQTIVRIALVAAAIGPLVVAVGSVCNGIKRMIDLVLLVRSFGIAGKISGIFGVVKTGLSGLSTMIVAHPIIAAIALTIIALVTLYTKCKWFHDGVNSLVSSLLSFLQSSWALVTNFFTLIPIFLTGIKNNIINDFLNFRASIYNLLISLLTMLGSICGMLWSYAAGGISTLVSNATYNMQAMISTIWTILSGGWSYVSRWAGALWGYAAGGVSRLINNVRSSLGGGLGSIASSMYRWGADMINRMIRGLLSGVHRVSQAAGQVARAIWSKLHFSRPEEGELRDYESWMPDFVHGLAESLQQALPELDSVVDQVGSHIQLGVVGGQPAAAGTSGTAYSIGDVSITINTQPGQDAKAIAQEVQRMIVHDIQRKI